MPLDETPGKMPAENHDESAASSPVDQDRRMTRAELMGRHTYTTRNRIDVHVWMRSGKYMARGRHEGRYFGVTLGGDRTEAEANLRQILNDLDNGAFVRVSESRRHPLKKGPPTRLELRELINRFVDEKRKLRGQQTAQDYQSRLMPVLEFFESPANRRRWPYAADINRAFALEYRGWLLQRQVSRNGHSMAKQRRVSAGHVHNFLSCMSTLLNWAKNPATNLLPIDFANPFNHDVVGSRPQRDPLAPPELPMALRIEMVQVMDAWQLAALALPFVIPNRPEDFAGLMMSEVNFNPREMLFGTRMGGDDFNKGRFSFRMAWPAELEPIVRWWMCGRAAGPLLLRRTVIEGRRRPGAYATSQAEIDAIYEKQLVAAKPGAVQVLRDRKRIFRQVLRTLGGVDEDELAKEFKKVLQIARPKLSIRFYDTRGSTTTDLKDAGVDAVFRRYVTAHSLKGEILGAYETQSLHHHMAKYFDFIRPLLAAISKRAVELGMAQAQ